MSHRPPFEKEKRQREHDIAKTRELEHETQHDKTHEKEREEHRKNHED